MNIIGNNYLLTVNHFIVKDVYVARVVQTARYIFDLPAAVLVGGDNGSLVGVSPKNSVTKHCQIERVHHISFVIDQPETAVYVRRLLNMFKPVFQKQIYRLNAVGVAVTPK